MLSESFKLIAKHYIYVKQQEILYKFVLRM